MATTAQEEFLLQPFFETCHVRPAQIPGFGRGMVCATPVRSKEPLLSVPISRCWTAEAARSCPLLASLGADVLEAVSDVTLIALHILVVRANDSSEEFRRHHVAELAATEIETLLDWSEEDLEPLAGSKWALVAPACKTDIEQEFMELQEVAGDFMQLHAIGVADFLWAQKALISRMMQFSMADGSLFCVLGLGQDMFNHSPEAPCGSDDVNLEVSEKTGEKVLVIRAYKDFDVGEQAFYSYSAASNGRLLMNAGFVIPGNPFDSVELVFTFPVAHGSQVLYESLARGLDAGLQRPGCAVVAEDAKPEFLEFLPAEREECEEPTRASLHVRLTAGAPTAQLERVLAFLRLAGLCYGAASAPLTQEALVASDSDAGARRQALVQLESSLAQMLKGYGDGPLQDEAEASTAAAAAARDSVELRARRRAMAQLVVAGERRILSANLDVVKGMFARA